MLLSKGFLVIVSLVLSLLILAGFVFLGIKFGIIDSIFSGIIEGIKSLTGKIEDINFSKNLLVYAGIAAGAILIAILAVIFIKKGLFAKRMAGH